MRVKYFMKSAVSKFVLLSSIGGVGFYFGRRSAEGPQVQVNHVVK